MIELPTTWMEVSRNIQAFRSMECQNIKAQLTLLLNSVVLRFTLTRNVDINQFLWLKKLKLVATVSLTH